jgi:type III pantothenate kinase
MFIDIGNTNISYLHNGECFNIQTNFLNSTEKCVEFLEKNNVKSLAIASVVPKVTEFFKNASSIANVSLYEITTNDINIKINLKNVKELGIDRAINAYMGLKKFGKNVIIVDFGTALTFDVVYNGEYNGGMIFPGLTMATHSLHTYTAKLPDVTITEYQCGVGKNTMEAISFGVCIGYTGVLKENIEYIENNYHEKFKIIFTGGSGKLFYKTIQNAVFEENLILEFLQEYYSK